MPRQDTTPVHPHVELGRSLIHAARAADGLRQHGNTLLADRMGHS